MRKRYYLLLFIVPVLFLGPAAQLHNETVGHISLEEYDNELYAKATLDKRYLALVLNKHAKCPAATMLSNCAPEYMENNLTIKVNGKPVGIRQTAQELTKRNLILLYNCLLYTSDAADD